MATISDMILKPIKKCWKLNTLDSETIKLKNNKSKPKTIDIIDKNTNLHIFFSSDKINVYLLNYKGMK